MKHAMHGTTLCMSHVLRLLNTPTPVIGRMSDANSSRSSVRSSASTLSVRSTVSSVPSYAPIGRPAFKP